MNDKSNINREAFIYRFKQAIEKAGLNQRRLAQKSGISTSTIGSWFGKNKIIPRADHFLKIVEVLHEDPWRILYGKSKIVVDTPKQIVTELQGTDHAMARVVDDLIDILLKKEIIHESDLNIYAQEVLSRRKILRSRMRG